MEIMSRVKYVFAENINETERTGIIEVYSAKILCFCDEESSKLILDPLKLKCNYKHFKISLCKNLAVKPYILLKQPKN